jgi:hypothetical protein
MEDYYGKKVENNRPQQKTFEEDGFSMDDFYGRSSQPVQKRPQPAFVDEGLSYQDYMRGGQKAPAQQQEYQH